MESVTQICTERLCLRPLKKTDFWFFFLLIGDERVRKYLGGTVGWRQRLSHFKTYLAAPEHVGIWIVCVANTKQPIGVVELGPHKDEHDYEVSYQFAPNSWGNGFAFEAVRAVVKHALNDWGMERVIAETQSANAASCNLLRKQGMVEISRVQRFGTEQIIFCTN